MTTDLERRGLAGIWHEHCDSAAGQLVINLRHSWAKSGFVRGAHASREVPGLRRRRFTLSTGPLRSGRRDSSELREDAQPTAVQACKDIGGALPSSEALSHELSLAGRDSRDHCGISVEANLDVG